MWGVGGILCTIGLVAVLCSCVYTLYIWWGVISDLEFISFILSIFLFFLSIPLSPLYVGVNGNWEPAVIIIIGLVGGGIIAFIGLGITGWHDEINDSWIKEKEREKKVVSKVKKPLSLPEAILWLLIYLSPIILLLISFFNS